MHCLKLILGLLAVSGLAAGHDEYLGKCPVFEPMPGFDWNRFKAGRWYAVEKFGTTHSRCLTYDFVEDDDGLRQVEQRSVLTGLKRFSLDNKVVYRGNLAAVSDDQPAKMAVRFPLNMFLSPSSYVVMDTDYSRYALVCTCQSKSILSLITFHRRSCTILQREPIRDPEISQQMHDLLDEKVDVNDDDEPSHDFDVIDHDNCNYDDDGKGLQLDVDKIIDAVTGQSQEVLDTVVEKAVSEFEERFVDDDDDRETLINAPLREKSDIPLI